MTAPERIWTAPTDGKCHVGFDTPSLNYTTEYVRADLAAVPAQVRVKPLVWGGLIAGSYRIQIKEGGIANLWYYSAEMAEDGEPTLIKGGYLTLISLEDLKAAAQADYESRILATIEPQPDPRTADYEQAYQYALTLADALMAKHYPDNKDWRPLGDLTGLLTQIDNMVAGKKPDPRDEVIARLVDALENKLHDQECPCNACSPMLAALAAAKAVQRG